MNDLQQELNQTETIIEEKEPELEEKRYTYQPTDEDGRPIGNQQVIKYKTEEELRNKFQEQNVLLIRKLRQETRKNRLGIVDQDELPENVRKFSGPVEFNPRELTEEERFEISRKLMDPTTAAEATAQLFEAGIGAPLEQVGSTLRDLQQDNIVMRARLEANAFKADNPDYYVCKENFEAICGWMVKNELEPVRENYQLAYDTLKAQGVLVIGPGRVEPVSIPSAPEPVENIPAPQPVPVHRVPTGLTRDISSNVGTPVPVGSEITYTVNGQTLTGWAAIQAMPGEEYGRRLLRDKNFARLVDKLEQERRKPRV